MTDIRCPAYTSFRTWNFSRLQPSYAISKFAMPYRAHRQFMAHEHDGRTIHLSALAVKMDRLEQINFEQGHCLQTLLDSYSSNRKQNYFNKFPGGFNMLKAYL